MNLFNPDTYCGIYCGACSVARLERIGLDGAGHWLDTQKKSWSCPGCGTPFSWYAAACHECGRSLASAAHKLSGWRKILCRFPIRAAYRKGKAGKEHAI